MQIVLQLVLLLVGFALLVKGADAFVEGVAGIARRFGIPQLVIGLTIVAMGTSAPEAAVSITAALRGNAGITVGNIVGSNILNILVILGLTAVVTRKPVPVQHSTIRVEIPYMLGVTLVMMVLGVTGWHIERGEGIVLWLMFLVYLGYLFHMAKAGHQQMTEEVDASQPVAKLVVMSVLGMACIILGSNVTVGAATELAHIFGMSERLIGLTIVALGTSLPELVTSISAARKGNADIAIGNIVGSNLFNILFVVGTTALITPITFQGSFMTDMVVALLSAVLLLWCAGRKGALGRGAGAAMLLAYAGYFVQLCY